MTIWLTAFRALDLGFASRFSKSMCDVTFVICYELKSEGFSCTKPGKHFNGWVKKTLQRNMDILIPQWVWGFPSTLTHSERPVLGIEWDVCFFILKQTKEQLHLNLYDVEDDDDKIHNTNVHITTLCEITYFEGISEWYIKTEITCNNRKVLIRKYIS